MEAIHKNLLEFMGNRNTFVIPVYQRNYAWDKQQCERLFDDIANVHIEGLKTYFLGASVVVSERSNELILIDGQQRMTTISLLLLAICKLLNSNKIKSSDEFLSETIWEDYLVNKRLKETTKYIRLKQVNQDSEAYTNLFYDESSDNYDNDPELKKTAIYKNYKILEKKVLDFCRKYTIDDLWQCFKKLQIVQIELKTEHGDKPQSVFETINATGKRLEDADLIRNYVLMNRSKEVQEKWFKEYWKPIERLTRIESKKEVYESHTTQAIWYYLMYQKASYFNERDIYKEFRQYVMGWEESRLERFINEIKQFAQYYRWFVVKADNPNFEKYLQMFRTLGQTTPYSYFMSLMDAYNEQKLDEKTVCGALKFILTYYIRRSVLDLSTNPYNSLYPTLVKNIKKSTQQSHLDSLYDVFARLPYGSRYPKDSELKDDMAKQEFYRFKKVTKIVLETMCNHQQKEKVTIDNTITIEHVMPQKLTPEWEKDLGDNWKDVRERCVHTIGNITLTGYSSEHKNKPFAEKKQLMKQYSHISLNKYFEDIDTWDEAAIRQRAEHMIDLFIKVYPDIKDREKYRTENDKDALLDFTDWVEIRFFQNSLRELDMLKKGFKPESIKIGDKKIEGKTWKEIMPKVLQYCEETCTLQAIEDSLTSKSREYSDELKVSIVSDSKISNWTAQQSVDFLRKLDICDKLECIQIKLQVNPRLEELQEKAGRY